MRQHHARRGLSLTEARVLYRLLDGPVDEGKLSNPESVALNRLRHAGIATEDVKAGLTEADRRRLAARARERGSVLVSTAAWPGATVVLGVRTLGWTGAGAGEGHLRSLDVRVTRSGRGAAAERVSIELTLPLAPPGADELQGAGHQSTRPAAGQPSLRLVG